MKNRSRSIVIFGMSVALMAVLLGVHAHAQTKNTTAVEKPATIRVGLVTKAQMAQAANNAAEAVRSTLADDLTGSGVEIVSLSARLPELIQAEVKDKDCAYVLYTSLTLKNGSNGGGMFARIVSSATSSATSSIPGSNVGTNAVRSARLIDVKNGSVMNNAVILIEGEKITGVGSNLCQRP